MDGVLFGGMRSLIWGGGKWVQIMAIPCIREQARRCTTPDAASRKARC